MQHTDDHADWTKSAGLLWISICLNLALAGVTWFEFRYPTAAATVAPSITDLSVVTVRTQANLDAGLSASVFFVTNRFQWRQVESTNYEEYTANLRAIGCPEKTVRDIILADVENHYESESQRLTAKRRETFWLGGKQRQLADRQLAAASRELEQEKQELLRRVLGIEWTGLGRSPFPNGDLTGQALSRFIFGPMAEATFQRGVATIERYESLEGEIRDRSQNILTDEDQAQLKSVGQALQRELSGVLTPQLFEEFTARSSAIDLFGNDTFVEAMAMTTAEARQIALAKFRSQDASRFLDIGSTENDSDTAAREMRFTNAVASLLGEKRFADFQLAQDRDFQSLFELGRDNGLSKETAVKIHDIRRLTAEEFKRLRSDPTLEDSARRQRLDEMQAAIQKEVSGALGGKAYGEYLRRDGAWLTNFLKL